MHSQPCTLNRGVVRRILNSLFYDLLKVRVVAKRLEFHLRGCAHHIVVMLLQSRTEPVQRSSPVPCQGSISCNLHRGVGATFAPGLAGAQLGQHGLSAARVKPVLGEA